MKANLYVTLALSLFFCALPTSGAASITINPSDDGALYTCAGCNPVNNGGYLLVAGYIQGIVIFPTAPITGPVTQAVLTVNPYGLPLGSLAVDVYGIQENTGSISASDANAGTYLGTMQIPANLGYGQDASFDVTPFVAAAGTPYVGFNLRDASGADVFSSLEINYGHPAQLHVTIGTSTATGPTITHQPTNQTVTAGGTATFSVGATGTGTLSYQWSLNTTNLAGATNAMLTLNHAQPLQAGSYAVLVGDANGFVLSSNALLTVNSPVGSCDPAPSGLVGWWPGEGNADDIIGGDNGTVEGGASFAPGKVGQGFRFDGTNGYVQIPDSAVLKPANVTCEAWIWLDPNVPANRGGEQIIFKKNTWNAWFEGYSLLKVTIDNGNGTYTDRFQFCISRSGDQVAINSQTIAQRGVWYHVAGTYDGNTSRLYVNGQLEATAVAGFALDYGTDPIYIGTSGTWAPYLSMFAGIIDEPSIYSRALSQTEIQSIYTAGSAGKCASTPPPACDPAPSGLVGWWPGEGNADDLIGGDNGTLAGGATFASGEVGQSFSFNGTDSYVKIPQTPSLNVGNQVTVEFWMKADPANALNTYQGLVTSDFYGIEIANGYVLGPLGVNFFISTDGGASTSPSSYPDTATVNGGGAVVSAGVWHHVAGTYDGTKLQLYIDGQPWGVPNYHTGAISPMLANSFVAVGSEDGRTICPGCVQARYFQGQIDEPAIYHRALSAAEILAIYNAGSAGKCAPTPPPVCDPAPAGMVGWWKGDGNAMDTIAGNNGVNQKATYTQGVVDQAFAFDPNNYPYGTYTGIQMADQPAYALTNSLTIEGWVRPRGDGYVIFWRGDNRPGLDPYAVSMQANNTVLFQITDANGNGASVGTTLAYNQWTHLAATLDGSSGNMSLYTNGVLASQMTTTVRPFGNLIAGDASGIGIGNLNDGQNNFPFTGDIDEIALYNRALTPAEIAAIYNAGSAGKCMPAPPVPTVFGFGPMVATNGASVSISGTSFSPVSVSNIVYFGAVQAAVVSASPTNLVVTVPVGATFAPISVTVNGLTTYSDQPFLPTFAGDGSAISATSFAPRLDLPAGIWPLQVVIADLDGDGKPDLIVANDHANTISLYRNISTAGPLTAASFAPPVNLTTPPGNYSPFGLAVADLDGDGKLDIIATDDDGTNVVSVFRNTCGPGNFTSNSFAPRVDFVTGSHPQGVTVADIDGDGRPDLLVANTGDGTLSILRNTSVPGSLTQNSFAPKVDFVTGGGCANVTTGDLDGDGRPDVVTVNVNPDTISLLHNASTPGSIVFDSKTDFSTPDYPVHAKLVDLDGDGKLDVVVQGYLSQTMSVFRNTSSPGTLNSSSLAARTDFPLGGRGHTTAVGDLNGDGKPDLAVVTELNSLLSVFQNDGSPGAFTTSSLAARVDFGTGWNAWGVSVGDLDGDGRPDVVFCNQYDNTISIYQNVVSFSAAPVITRQPTSAIVTVGDPATFTVTADGTAPLTYQWSVNAANIPEATNATLVLNDVQLTDAGTYAVTVTNAFGSITSSNAVLQVNQPPVADATATVPLVISVNNSNATVVLNGSLSFDPDGDALQYTWYLNGGANPLASGVVAVVVLPLGTNAITLVVNDGLASRQQTISVAVITLAQAVQQLQAAVNTDVAKEQSLIATLNAALAAIDRSNPTAAINQLQAFQNQVNAQIAPLDAALAQSLIASAQSVINALAAAGGNPHQHLQAAMKGNGKVHLNFSGIPQQTYIIETSTNLVDWEMIGVATNQGDGTFNFDDTVATQIKGRFYRVVTP